MLFLLPLLATLVPSVAAYGKGFTNTKVVSAYFPSYQMAPADVPYAQYTHLDYFVFTTTPDASAISQAGIDDSLITEFVTRAHAAGVTTSYTVGGWTGSQYFSTHVSTATGRTTFARTLVAVMNQYGFDGIDIDWEYPAIQGEGDNVISPSDTANFLLFLQTLRSVAGVDARLSMASNVAGLYGPDGAVVKDLSGFAAVLDYVTIMSYDITGTWSGFTGANAPLYTKCQPSSNPYSIDSAVRAYVASGFARNHILIGLPAYSYSYYVTLPFTQTTCTDGTKSTLYNYATSGSTCGNLIGFGEQYLYRQLVANGWFKGGSVRRTLDSTSQTWVIYQPSTGLFIPTETTTSAWAKARYAFTNRLAGVNIFDASGDTSDGALAASLRLGLRLDYGDAPVTTKRMAKRHLEEKKRSASVGLGH